MTIGRDSESLGFLDEDFDDTRGQGEARSEDKISIWLAGSIIFFLIAVFAISALMVNKIYFQPPKIRTAVEKDLVKYRAAIKDNPNDADAYIGLADVYLSIEQPKNAVKALNKALEIEPRSWNTHFGLGLAYKSMNDVDKATTHFLKAAAIDPNNEFAYYQLGRLYQDEKNYGEAIQAYKKSLKVNSTLSDVHYYLGQCYEETNKIDLAKQEYREALVYVDSYPEAEKALARLK